MDTWTFYWPYLASTVAGAAVTAVAFLWFKSPEPSHLLLSALKYLVHIAVGTLIFSTIALAAAALHLLIHALEPFQMSDLIISGLVLTEHALFISDLMLFFVFIFRSSAMFAAEVSEA